MKKIIFTILACGISSVVTHNVLCMDDGLGAPNRKRACVGTTGADIRKSDQWVAYEQGLKYIASDPDTAMTYFEQAAQAGNAEAANILARTYREGEYVGRNMVTASEWFVRAIDLGCPLEFISARDDYECDGTPQALYTIGHTFKCGKTWLSGDKLEPNAAEAEYYLTKATCCECDGQYRVEAAYELADLYMSQGKKEEAAQWFQQASEQGHDEARRRLASKCKDTLHAQYALGVAYKYGQKWDGEEALGIDDVMAEDLLRKVAANDGRALAVIADAQYELADLYMTGGHGIEPNKDIACQWYCRAAGKGHLKANESLMNLVKLDDAFALNALRDSAIREERFAYESLKSLANDGSKCALDTLCEVASQKHQEATDALERLARDGNKAALDALQKLVRDNKQTDAISSLLSLTSGDKEEISALALTFLKGWTTDTNLKEWTATEGKNAFITLECWAQDNNDAALEILHLLAAGNPLSPAHEVLKRIEILRELLHKAS